jgi:hypothetical protein
MSKYHIHDLAELKEVLFHDFQIIKKMRSPEANKIKLLSTLFSINPNSWRVVGITPEALKIFEKYDFQKKSGMRINRSHIRQRYGFYQTLLDPDNKIQTAEEFWNTYYENDMTILASASENMSADQSIFENAYPVPQDDRKLFQTSGYAWKHRDEEEEFLKDLFQKHLSKNEHN